MTSFLFKIYLMISLCVVLRADNRYVDRKYVKCLVCKIVVDELYKEIKKVEPSLKSDIGGYVLEENIKSRPNVELRKSVIYLVELMDHICKRLDEYVRAFDKSTGMLEVIPLTMNGNMNPALSEYDIVKDGDLDSLKFYCDSIISEYEEELIELFKMSEKNIVHKICYSTEVCMNLNSDDSYVHNEF